MITRTQVPQALSATLDVAFKEGREAMVDGAYRAIVLVEPTTSDAKQMVFYGDKGRIRRLRGERQPQTFAEYKMTVTVDEWEMTYTTPRTVLDDDQTGGILRRKITNFGNAVETSIEAETWEFLHRGTSMLGFDKARLFDFNHRYVDSRGQTNTLVAAQANMHLGGSQLDATTLQLTEQYFAGILSDKNKPLGMKLTHIAVKRGSPNSKSARELLNSTYTVESNSFKDNIFRGRFELIEFDYGFGASEWLAFDLSDSEMRPVVVLSHSVSPGFNNMEFTQQLQDSYTGFWRNEFAFGIYGRFDWNPGDWRTVFVNGSSGYTFAAEDSESQRVPTQVN